MVSLAHPSTREELMEKSWNIAGAYANWTMTVTAVPPAAPYTGEPPPWAMENFGRLADHFADLVNVFEHASEHELSRAFTWRPC